MRGSAAPGSVLGGDYRLEVAIGAGGFGTVYRATQLSTQRQRAVKVLHPSLETDPDSRRRFLEEARVGGRIESEHVVEVIASGFDEATRSPWIAMELLEGQDLHAYVREHGSLEPALLRTVFAQLGHALGAAHDQGIIHRDLKPENIFLCRPRRHRESMVVKVLDFGIAKSLEPGRTAGPATAAIGSPLFMAPEQGTEGAPIRPATDVWPLGLIAFFALTGLDYWRSARGGQNLQAMFAEVLVEPIEAPSARARWLGAAVSLPPEFDAWFMCCLDRDPKRRFKDARACVAALDGVLAGRSRAAEAFAPTEEAAVVTPAPSTPVLAKRRGLAQMPAMQSPAPQREAAQREAAQREAAQREAAQRAAAQRSMAHVPATPAPATASRSSPGGPLYHLDHTPTPWTEHAPAPPKRPWGMVVMVVGALTVAGAAGWVVLRATGAADVAELAAGEGTTATPRPLPVFPSSPRPSPTPTPTPTATPAPTVAVPPSPTRPGWWRSHSPLYEFTTAPASPPIATTVRFEPRDGIRAEVVVDGVSHGRAPVNVAMRSGLHLLGQIEEAGPAWYTWRVQGFTSSELIPVAPRREPADERPPPGRGYLLVRTDLPLTLEVDGRPFEEHRSRRISTGESYRFMVVAGGPHRLRMRDTSTGREELLDVVVATDHTTSVWRMARGVGVSYEMHRQAIRLMRGGAVP